jgi:hypothetical protein
MIPKFSEENFNQIGQIYLEKRLLNPLRESLSKGEIIKTPEGFKKVSSDLFQRIHEADCFAEIIIRGGKDMEFSISLAKVIIPLEQTLKFQTTGSLESFKVQSASLPLKGDNLNIYVLRDYKGIIRMAFFIHGNLLFQKRKNAKDSWTKNTNLSSFELMSLLRYNNYNVPGSEPSLELIKDEIQTFKDELTLSSRQAVQNRIPGEKIIMGLSASPGRVTGRILLGIARRVPEDFVDHILVASSISPNENTFIFHSSGIVATGGGILSHAGLIANQFNKPALIISGKWKQESDGLQILNYNTLEFKIEPKTVNNFNITLYYDFQEIEYQMRDGDLVSLDTDEGSLQVLGQERDTIALYEGLKSLGRTNEDISKVNDVQQLLVLRGKKLHIRHKIEKILQRLSEPVLAKYAVQEILIGNFLAGIKSTPEEKIYLLTLILENNKIGDFAENCISQTAREIEISYIRAYSKAEKNIPIAQYPFEVIMPRLEVFKLLVLIKNVISSLSPKLSQKIKVNISDVNDLNDKSIRRLEQLQINLIHKIQYLTGNIEQKEILRHLFRQLKRVNLLINKSFTEQSDIKKLQDELEINDSSVCQKYGDRFILRPGDGTIELAPMIGWKAANLAELEQLGGNGLVPTWFVITDKAFQHVLDTPVKEIISHQVENISVSASLRDVIDDIVSRNDINNNEKSALIRNLWNLLSLPADVKKEVIQSYLELEKNFSEGSSSTDSELKPFVAIRSSSCEEDAEIAARAGEFETYLFIHGEDLLIDYLKRTWSGLWTERAIHNRSVMGSKKIQTRGGVIVQRIVWSRVSGVLQTINVAKNN